MLAKLAQPSCLILHAFLVVPSHAGVVMDSQHQGPIIEDHDCAQGIYLTMGGDVVCK